MNSTCNFLLLLFSTNTNKYFTTAHVAQKRRVCVHTILVQIFFQPKEDCITISFCCSVSCSLPFHTAVQQHQFYFVHHASKTDPSDCWCCVVTLLKSPFSAFCRYLCKKVFRKEAKQRRGSQPLSLSSSSSFPEVSVGLKSALRYCMADGFFACRNEAVVVEVAGWLLLCNPFVFRCVIVNSLLKTLWKQCIVQSKQLTYVCLFCDSLFGCYYDKLSVYCVDGRLQMYASYAHFFFFFISLTELLFKIHFVF